MVRRRGDLVRWGMVALIVSLMGEPLFGMLPREAAEGLRPARQISTATIHRDEWGRPSITAENEYDLFEAYGYAVAQDRLWQLEIFRRTARGRLAEVLGNQVVSVEVKGPIELVQLDIEQRQQGYTEDEYRAMYDALPDFARLAIAAYRDGINRYLEEARGDPHKKLPWEFHVLGYIPEPWSVTDSMATCRLAARIFGERGGREVRNLALYQHLVRRHGEEVASEIFDDLRWRNDPHAPVTVPLEDQAVRPLALHGGRSLWRRGPRPHLYRWFPDLRAFVAAYERWQQKRRALFQLLGLPVTFGSFGIVLDGKRSRRGYPLLLGGPQMGFLYPDIVHEVHLKAPGWHVTGMAFAGGPAVLIGHNERIAWTTTSGPGDNTDLYIERLNPENPDQYLFHGAYRNMEVREETILVRTSPWGFPLRAAKKVTLQVKRTVHGPVLFVDPANHVAVSVKRAHWMKEHETWLGFMEINRARTWEDFERAVHRIPTSHHFLYADVEGNIGYWLAGWVPIRPPEYDPRLPLPGTGEAEWESDVSPRPHVLNPRQGWLANWNNKPAVDFENPDDLLFGKQHRVLRIMELLSEPLRLLQRRQKDVETNRLDVDDLIELERDIARFDDLGPKTEFLRGLLLQAVEEAGVGDPTLDMVRAMLQTWDGAIYADALSSRVVDPANVLFEAIVRRLIESTFGDEVESEYLSEVSLNALIHVLEGERSSVPPARDYFNGRDWREVVLTSVRRALAGMEETPPVLVREMTSFRHLFGFRVGPSIPKANRATYTQIVELSTPPRGWNRLPSGQSAFIRAHRIFPWMPVFTPALFNQRSLFREFGMKPMPF